LNEKENINSEGDFIKKQEELKMIYLRSFLNKIEKFYLEKEVSVQKLFFLNFKSNFFVSKI